MRSLAWCWWIQFTLPNGRIQPRSGLRISEVSLRYAWIAAWLARLGVARFCLVRLAGGSPKLGWAAVSAFGGDMAAAAQRIVGEIRKLPAPILPVVRAF
jgi:hypothetical protein